MTTAYSSTPFHTEVPRLTFSWLDYGLFCGMLSLSALIGIYFGCFGNKQNNKNDYLLGGKTMKVFPVAMSLIASHTSGTSLLAVPADIYKYGTTYWWMCISITLSCLAAYYIFTPVFWKLQIISTYEYLNIRFNNKVRIFASFLFILSVLFYNPIVIYVPALAFSQATGINLHLITPIVCAVCIFYTTIGGLKAVVWTDTLQTVSIAGCMGIVFCMGIASAGGFGAIWEKALEGERLDLLDFNLDPTRRGSFWALAVGYTAHWISNFSINQGGVQRFLSVPSMSDVKKMLIMFCIGMVTVKTVGVFTGLIIFAKYSDCDPLSTKQVHRNDQLLPYYVMDVAGNIPGLPGLFIAGVFSAALSTLSTTLNNLSAIIYEDIISPFMPTDLTEKQISNVLKLIVVITGIVSTSLVLVVEHLGGVVPLVASSAALTGGPLLGLFCLGMLFPFANSKGALYGGISGLLFTGWMVLGNQWYKQNSLLEDFAKPVSTDGCSFYTNLTTTKAPPTLPSEQPFILYRISFWYFSFVGTFTTIVTGLAISWFTRKDNPPIHPDLLSPIAQYLVSKRKISDHPPDYRSVDKALQLVTLASEKEEGDKSRDSK